jgi:hypothetical protein
MAALAFRLASVTRDPAASALVRPAHKLHGVFDMPPVFGQFHFALCFKFDGVLSGFRMALAPCASSNCRAWSWISISRMASCSSCSERDRDHQSGAGTVDVDTYQTLTVCIPAPTLCKTLIRVMG